MGAQFSLSALVIHLSERMTLCTVAIPVYNRQHIIRAAIESALAQDVADLEVLVVDDCSTDGAWDVIRSYSDPRLRAVRNESNLGLFGNMNRCLDLARGKYIRILCDDDRLLPGCLRHETELMEAHPEAALLATRIYIVNKAGERVGMFGEHLKPGLYHGKDVIPAALWVLSHYGHTLFGYPSGVLMRAESVQKAGHFDTGLKQIGDVAYFLKLAQQGDLAVTDHAGSEVLDHADGTTQQMIKNGTITQEWAGLARQWRDAVPSRRMYKQILGQTAMYSLFLAQSFWRHKHPEAAKQYFRAARDAQVSPLALPVEALRFLRIRLPLMKRNVRIQPLQPYQPFPQEMKQGL